MKKKIKCLISVLLVILQVLLCSMTSVYGDAITPDPIIMVSLGDSYSSGEGITPFYGQDAPITIKATNEDWLAHRSTKSWPSLLKIPGIPGTMGNYNVKNTNASMICKWYFKASSGAETKHFNQETQSKSVNKQLYKREATLPKQLDVFKNIDGNVDYVTLTIGGNDVNFSGLITDCAM